VIYVDVDKIVDVLESGGLVVSPTDTIYGIMGDALNENVIRKVYEAKKRPYNKPLILLMNNYEMIRKYTSEISDLEEKIINRFHPGLVTIILKKNNLVSNLITGNGEYVGIRIPDNKYLLEIINKLGRPVISSSANISDEDVITNVDMLDNQLKEKIDYIEDGGVVESVSSTIVKVVDGKLEILREGKLADDIREYVEEL